MFRGTRVGEGSWRVGNRASSKRVLGRASEESKRVLGRASEGLSENRVSSSELARPSATRACALAILVLLTLRSRSVVAQAQPAPGRKDVRPSEAYFAQLETQIEALKLGVEREPESALARRDLSASLYLHARFSGQRDEMARARSEASECVRMDPQLGVCFLTRARASHALRLLAEARADAKRAAERGAKPLEAAGVIAEVDWSEGRYAEAARAIRAAAASRPTMETLARRARLEHELGHYPLAEHLSRMAEATLSEHDAIQRAWLDAQRGAQNRELGRFEVAELLLRRALAAAPVYAYALAQLAKVLVARGELREATRLYRKLVLLTFEPEYLGELAAVHRRRGHLEQADALSGEASRLFEEGLRRYPAALRVPAATFYLGEGSDVPRAIRLLEAHREFRGSAELELLARAYLAAGKLAQAESAIRAALMLEPLSLQTLHTAQATYKVLADTANR